MVTKFKSVYWTHGSTKFVSISPTKRGGLYGIKVSKKDNGTNVHKLIETVRSRRTDGVMRRVEREREREREKKRIYTTIC